VREGRARPPKPPDDAIVQWALKTRILNDFLNTHYTVEQVKQMPRNERETYLMMANARNKALVERMENEKRKASG
jgi:hypothetical protein